MIVWGGEDPHEDFSLGDGGRYDPARDTWAAMSTDGAPLGRVRHTAVWAGSEMIVWGGLYCKYRLPRQCYSIDTGGRYDPATDTWAATSLIDTPSARYGHTAVWTDSEMLVWGGFDDDYFDSGSRYDPVTDTWAVISTDSAPTARRSHTAVWTGSEMIVWGGYDSSDLNTGGRYCASAGIDGKSQR